MATHYIKLEQGITVKDIKATRKAFEFLYGESVMIVKGDVPTVDGVGAFGINAEVKSLGRNTLTVHLNKYEGDVVIPLEQLGSYKPELMYMTIR